MHWLITGTTGSGKSRVLKETIIPAHRRLGRKVVVLDPLGVPWPCDWQTTDPERFMATVEASRGLVIVIDEWPHFMEFYPWAVWRRLIWCYTIGRNYGHLSYAVAQRAMMVPPSVRNQCSNALVFKQTSADCAIVADLLAQPAAMEPASYPLGTAMLVQPGQNPRRLKVF